MKELRVGFIVSYQRKRSGLRTWTTNLGQVGAGRPLCTGSHALGLELEKNRGPDLEIGHDGLSESQSINLQPDSISLYTVLSVHFFHLDFFKKSLS